MNDDIPYGAGATFSRPGWIFVSSAILESSALLPVLAHELGHVTLRHDLSIVLGGAGRTPTPAEYRSHQEQRELDANRRAVEIMVRVLKMPEQEAFRTFAGYLLLANAARGGRPIAIPHGHIHPCDQLRALAARFPQEWENDLKCKKTEGKRMLPDLGRDIDLNLKD